MLNIDYYSDYLTKLASTRLGRTLYSIGVGAVGAVILVVFLAKLLTVATLGNLMPFIFGFNAALTGYMVIEKTGDALAYKRTVAMISGVALVIVATLILNVLYFQGTGIYLIFMEDLLLLLPVSIIASVLGAMLAIKYFQIRKNI
ncbi:MAG: hypothetical protein P8Y38_10845 [Deltaproteobacteria bacterium]